MADAVEILALAYYFTGEEKYAARAAVLVRTWFLDAATRMNPHLEYGQSIPGRNEGRGEGLIETRAFVRIVDSVGLVAGSSAWTAEDDRGLKAWFEQFLKWMLDGPHGRDEAAAENNHGTFYDVQVASYSLFIGQPERAREVLQTVGERRIAVQIEPDGRQPLELERTKAWSYSVGNLAGLMALARLGEHVDVDLWDFETADGRSIRRAIEFLAPFGLGEQKWPYQQINGFSAEMFYPVLRMAKLNYPDGPFGAAQGRPSGAAVLWLSPIQPINDLHRR